MKRIATRLATVLSLAATACIRTGPSAADDVRHNVRGDVGELSLMSGQGFHGELLAVTNTTFVILADRRVAIAPRSIVASVLFGSSGLATPGGAISEGDFATLRRRSRFPYGITSAAMAGLLSASGQSSPDTLGKAPR